MQWFFYGTLLDADIRRAVFPHLEGRLELTPAWLPGFRRVRAKGAHYPVLAPRTAAWVPGLVARGLDERALVRAAHFEGHEYEPRRLEVRLGRRGRTRAWLFMPRHGGFATAEPWSYGHWLRTRKRLTMPQVAFWMNQPGVDHLRSPELLWHVRRQIRRIAADTPGAPAPLEQDWRLAA